MIGYERFLRLRHALWDAFERGLDSLHERRRPLGHQGLETLAIRYRQILHDHALAAARFPGTAAARRLQTLALAGTHSLQRDEGKPLGGLRTFVSRTYPLAFRRQLPLLGVTLALFAGTALLGLFLATARPGIGLALLGPRTVERLKHGEIWTEELFRVAPTTASSSAVGTLIATNNMSVAITAWAGGAAAGLGALWIVALNGFMLGAILGVTAHYGLAGRLLEFVAAHGPLEITLILTTAAAGLHMGRALVAAADRPRADVLREAGRDALIVLVGCLPWFVLLGLVEARLSPLPTLPASFKALLGCVLVALYLIVAVNPALKEEAR
jgi:uncharacterized membrane protein SpoIIM required for sporulation